MSENELTPRNIGRKVVIGIIVTVCTTVAIGAGKLGYDAYKESTVKEGLQTTLEKYATDINNNSFEANYYFANTVPQFFELKDMSPRLINEFWKNNYDKIFTDDHIRFDYETLKIECKEDCYIAHVDMYHSYFKTDEQKKFTDERSEYSLKFDEEFKIVEVTQKVWGH